MNSQHNSGEEPIRSVVVRIDENVKSLVASRADHESRIRALEKWQWKILGAGAFIGAAAAVYEAFRR